VCKQFKSFSWHEWTPFILVIGGLFVLSLGTAISPAFDQPVVAGIGALITLYGFSLFFLRSQVGKKHPDVAPILVLILIALCGGFFLIGGAVSFAPTSDSAARESCFRAAIGWGLAYFSSGFLGGFLFGIPRVLQRDGAQAPRTDSSSLDYQQRVNTNLEDISDWLTKIIVGLGLVQLRTVPVYLHKASVWMAQSFSVDHSKNAADAASFASAFIVFFAIVGFVGGYLLTRLFLAGAFRRADTTQSVTVTEEAGKKTEDLSISQINRFRRASDQNKTALANWLKSKGIEASLTTFTNAKNFSEDRRKAIADLNIN
jgi:hypothetical protein